jgi:cysteinyl-tRNA synthetase, unknown class
MIKSLLSLSLAMVMILLMAGCGGGGNGATSSNPVDPSISSLREPGPVTNSQTEAVICISSLQPMGSTKKADPSIAQQPDIESAARATAAERALTAATLSPKSLSQIRTWAAQLDNITGSGSVTSLAGSTYDLLVLEPVCTLKGSTFDTKTMVTTMKASYAGGGANRKLVLAYVDIGQAESWRNYWTWSAAYSGSGSLPSGWPAFIAGPNAAGSTEVFPVTYWDPNWQNIIINNQASLINEAINDGFDGVFIDCVDSYNDPSVISRAKAAGKNAPQEMVSFIQKIRAYAQSKKPGFIIMQNNAADLGVTYPLHMQNIDIINQEAVWYIGYPTSTWTDPNGYDKAVSSTVSQSLIDKLKYYKNAGKVVCDLEYAKGYASKAYGNGAAQCYLTYCSRTSLSKLTTTPPPTPAPIVSPTPSPTPSITPTPTPTSTPSPTPTPTSTASPTPTPTPTSSPTPTGLAPIPLSQVKNWAIELQNTETSQAAAALAASRYHMLILEGNNTLKGYNFNTKALTDQLKTTYAGNGPYRKLLIAYVSIGEAEDYRTYWTWGSSWPSYVLTSNPDWVGDYPVAFWNTSWKNIVIYNQDSLVNQAINGGFDGIFMDVVDVFLLPEVATRAAREGKNPAQEMANFIKEIRTYAQAKKPGFIMIQNNALELGIQRPESISSIDAIHQECIWYDGTTSGWNVAGCADKVVNSAWTSDYLVNLAVYMSAGKPVFDLEYAKTNASTAYSKSLARGYIPYCSQTALSQLTTTPPPGY